MFKFLYTAVAVSGVAGVSLLFACITVRLCEDKLGLIRQVLDSSSTAYKKKQKVSRNLLHLTDNHIFVQKSQEAFLDSALLEEMYYLKLAGNSG